MVCERSRRNGRAKAIDSKVTVDRGAVPRATALVSCVPPLRAIAESRTTRRDGGGATTARDHGGAWRRRRRVATAPTTLDGNDGNGNGGNGDGDGGDGDGATTTTHQINILLKLRHAHIVDLKEVVTSAASTSSSAHHAANDRPRPRAASAPADNNTVLTLLSRWTRFVTALCHVRISSLTGLTLRSR